jgi:hypothetical protein
MAKEKAEKAPKAAKAPKVSTVAASQLHASHLPRQDPNAPKKPLAAYMLFCKARARLWSPRPRLACSCSLKCIQAAARALAARALTRPRRAAQDMRPVVKEENPGISFGEIGKVLGSKWSEADEPTKKARQPSYLLHSCRARRCSITAARSPALAAGRRRARAPRPEGKAAWPASALPRAPGTPPGAVHPPLLLAARARAALLAAFAAARPPFLTPAPASCRSTRTCTRTTRSATPRRWRGACCAAPPLPAARPPSGCNQLCSPFERATHTAPFRAQLHQEVRSQPRDDRVTKENRQLLRNQQAKSHRASTRLLQC